MADTLEVRSCELPERSYSGFVVCPSGICGVLESPQPLTASVAVDVRHPAVPAPFPTHAPVAGCVIAGTTVVGEVLRASRDSQIAAPVVQFLAIGMVGVHAIWSACNQSVHKRASAIGDNGIALRAYVPFLRRNQFGVDLIDDGKESTIQRNKDCSIRLWNERTRGLAASLGTEAGRLAVRTTKERTANLAGKLERHFDLLTSSAAPGMFAASPGTFVSIEFYQKAA